MQNTISIALIVGTLGTSYAQRIVVADVVSRDPVPYATAQVVGEERGFVADDLGRMDIGAQSLGAKLMFRSIGYRDTLITVSDIQHDTVLLNSRMLQLKEVVVRPEVPTEYIKRATRKVAVNYSVDSFATRNYFQERIEENDGVLNFLQAFLEVKHPGYQVDQDSFEVRIRAARKADVDELQFMSKERNKEIERELKKAKKKGEDIPEEDGEWPIELGNPPFLLKIDPLRNVDYGITVNDDDVDFLDSNNFRLYDYWYGTPVPYGERTLVVIHFGPEGKAKEPLMSGTLWIDQESDAFVKIAFGLSDEGQKHLIPGYLKAAMWLYGFGFDIHRNNIEFEYKPHGDRWRLHATRVKADITLEKRRIFSANDVGHFKYQCEMLTTETFPISKPFTSKQSYEMKKFMSHQLRDVSDAEWQTLMKEKRSYF